MDNKVEISSTHNDKFASLLFRDKILPEVFARLKKDLDKKGEIRISQKDLRAKLDEYYGKEYEDLKKVYTAFGGKPIKLSPDDLVSRFRRARIPTNNGKYVHIVNENGDVVIKSNDFPHLPDPQTIRGIPEYESFEPDTYYGTTFGPGLSVGLYTNDKANLGADPGMSLSMESIPSTIEGLNRAIQNRSAKSKPDIGMDIISDYIPGNNKSKQQKLGIKTKHELFPRLSTKKGQNPEIKSIEYIPQGRSSLVLDETKWSENSLFPDIPSGYEDRVTKDSIENVRKFLRGSDKSHSSVASIRNLMADNLRFKDNIDLSKMPKTPEELHEIEVKPIEESSIPSKEEISKSIKEIEKSSKIHNNSIRNFSVLRNAFSK